MRMEAEEAWKPIVWVVAEKDSASGGPMSHRCVMAGEGAAAAAGRPACWQGWRHLQRGCR